MTETACYLTTIDPPVYTMLHRPADTPRGALVLCGPFAEEQKAAQRALVETARRLAADGWLVARFDWRGTGDSGGHHGESSITTRLDDLVAVTRWLRGQAADSPLALVGLRLGATLAWLAAGQHDLAVDSLVAWEPITSGQTYMNQNLRRSAIRSELTAGSSATAADGQAAEEPYPAFDFDGFEVSATLHRELATIDLADGPPPPLRRLLVLQISGSSRVKKPLERLAELARGSGVEASVAAVAVEAFWSAIGLVDTTPVRELTAAWLRGEAIEEASA